MPGLNKCICKHATTDLNAVTNTNTISLLVPTAISKPKANGNGNAGAKSMARSVLTGRANENPFPKPILIPMEIPQTKREA